MRGHGREQGEGGFVQAWKQNPKWPTNNVFYFRPNSEWATMDSMAARREWLESWYSPPSSAPGLCAACGPETWSRSQLIGPVVLPSPPWSAPNGNLPPKGFLQGDAADRTSYPGMPGCAQARCRRSARLRKLLSRQQGGPPPLAPLLAA